MQHCDWLGAPSWNVTRFHASLVSWPDEHTKHLSLFSPVTEVPFLTRYFTTATKVPFLTRYFTTATKVPFLVTQYFTTSAKALRDFLDQFMFAVTPFEEFSWNRKSCQTVNR